MKVLSLFDGVSCGQLALNNIGVVPECYYASEVDRHCITVTSKHYPNTIHMGSVTGVTKAVVGDIDLLMAGSPCQGFSNSNQTSTDRGLEHPHSKLFFEFLRVLGEVKPKYWLLENVRLKAEWLDLLNGYLGVTPVVINSKVVSAQSRVRLYWSNFDITPIVPNYPQSVISDIIYPHNWVGITLDPSTVRHTKNYLTWGKQVQAHRAYYPSSVMGTLVCPNNKKIVEGQNLVRKLHIVEAERLQTMPDNYTQGIPKTARFKAVGNGWTIRVIEHILSRVLLG